MSEAATHSNETWRLTYPDVATFEDSPDFVGKLQNGGFTHLEIKEFCDGSQDGLLLERNLCERLTDSNKFLISDVRFEEVEEWAEGRKDSLHQVQFGNLLLNASSGLESSLEVAVKPFHIWRAGAINEAAAMLRMPATTGIDGFELVGLIRVDGIVAVVSRFEKQVTSLDNMEWNLGIDESFRDTINVVSALQKSALTLARIHQAGMIHSDAQIKNMAVVTDPDGTCKVRLIDLENAKWRDTADIVDRQKYLDGVHGDVSTLVGSILVKGLWRDSGYEDKARAIEAVFADPYLSYLRHPGNKDENYDVELHEQVEDRVSDVLDQI